VYIAEGGKVFSRFLWEVLYRVFDSFTQPTEVLERTDVLEEVGFGSREGDAVHPLLVVLGLDIGRREEAPLAGSCPPSSHQSTCNQGRSAVSMCRYVLKNLV